MKEFLSNSADAFLIRVDLEGGRDTTNCDVELVRRLGRILATVPHHKLRIILAVMEREKQGNKIASWNKIAFWKKPPPPSPLVDMSIRLENVRPTDLNNWAELTEAVVRHPRLNKIMDVVNDIYAQQHPSQAKHGLSVRELRERLERFVIDWIANAPSHAEAMQEPRHLVGAR